MLWADLDVPGFLRGQFGELRYVYQHHLGTCKKASMRNTELVVEKYPQREGGEVGPVQWNQIHKKRI